SPETPLRPIVELISPEAFRQSRLIEYRGNDGPRASLIAGCFMFATPESEWLARHLPPVLHVSAFGAHSPQWFQSTLQIVEAEIAQDLPGSAAVVDRLAEVLFVHALRTDRKSTRLNSSHRTISYAVFCLKKKKKKKKKKINNKTKKNKKYNINKE